MRNRTVQSVLARRHMFNNGGMVPPTPKASGILASSPSLVDAVSNDALSDMGGGTLSMAQGGAAVNMQPSYIFNEGGIAKFRDGGINKVSDNEIVAKVLNGTATAAERNAVKQSSYGQREDVARAIRLAEGTEQGGPIPLRPGVKIADYEATQNKAKMGTLTDEDRRISSPFNKKPPSVEVAQKINMTDEQMRQMGYPPEEIKRIKELMNQPLSVFQQPAIDINAPSPGEEAIVNIAESALTRPIPQVDDPKIKTSLPPSVAEVSKQDLRSLPSDNEITYDQLYKQIETMPFTPEVETGPETLPPPGGTAPREKVTVENLVDKPIVSADLAKATNKNTETDAVEAVVEASDMMGGEGGSVGADGEMVTGDDTIIVRNDEGESKPVNSDVLISAFKLNGPETDEKLQLAVSEDLVSTGQDLVEGKPTNMNSLRKRIEALIPAVEEDPQTQGLLIAMLGASIAGGESPDALKNISEGMQKALPGLINFGMKQKAAERARQTEIGKLVIGEDLRLAAEGRAEKREIAKEGRKIIDYVSGPTVQTLANGKKIPPLSPRSMTRDEYALLKKRNPDLKMYPAAVVKKLDLQKAITGKLSIKDQKDLAELRNKYMKRDNNPPKAFAAYKSEIGLPRLTLTSAGKIMLPKNLADAKALGLIRTVKVKNQDTGKMEEKEIINLGSVADENDVQRFTGEYQRLAGGYKNIYDELQKLYQLTDKAKGKASLVGPGSIMSKVGDAAQAFAEDGVPGAALLRDYALGISSNISPQTAFEAQGRLTLAKITPMILGESGKTISDADRVRVARALGYQIDKDINGDDVIGALTTNIFTSEASVRKALSEVSNVIRNSYLDIHKIYQQEMISVGREIKPFDEKTTKKLRFSLVPKKGP
jgi:hypothetical protein